MIRPSPPYHGRINILLLIFLTGGACHFLPPATAQVFHSAAMVIQEKNRKDRRSANISSKREYVMRRRTTILRSAQRWMSQIYRTYLNLPSEIVPATLKKTPRPVRRPFGGGPPGDRPRGPPSPRFKGGSSTSGERDGYRGGPRGPSGGFGGDKGGGAPADYQPSFRGPATRPGFGQGGRGFGPASGASFL